MAGEAAAAFEYTRLLDETLLHLSVLEHSAGIGPMHAWRARCVGLLSAFDDDLRELALTPAQAFRLRLSHALLLDDATISAIPEMSADEWAGASLCRIELGEPDAAEAVSADLDALAADPAASPAWLHWYICLLTAGLLRRSPKAAARKRKLFARLCAAWPAAAEESGAS